MRRRPLTRFDATPARVIAVAAALGWAMLPMGGGDVAASPQRPAPPSPATVRLRDLQSKRDQVRSRQAQSASSVNTLKASDAQIQAALTALDNNIAGQSSLLEEAQRAVTSAEADQKDAEAQEATAETELASLHKSIKAQAIAAYVNSPRDETLQFLSAKNLADAARERTLRDLQTSNGLDAAERYRSVQEDLGIARTRATAAAQTAAQRRTDVSNRLDRLKKAQAEQQKFSDQVENRIESAYAEAVGLTSLDSALSNQIVSQQSAIVAELTRSRASAARRGVTRTFSGAATSFPNTNGVGIVTVRGIRVAESIAGNLDRLLGAAEAAGISMSGGGYRDPAAQIAVRRSNCGTSDYAIYQMPASSCSPPTARPGTSMHERGLAVDFTYGGRTLTRGSAAFSWMQANAASFGFYNLPSEPWHWSTNGN